MVVITCEPSTGRWRVERDPCSDAGVWWDAGTVD
jgi:hypothetical protein